MCPLMMGFWASYAAKKYIFLAQILIRVIWTQIELKCLKIWTQKLKMEYFMIDCVLLYKGVKDYSLLHIFHIDLSIFMNFFNLGTVHPGSGPLPPPLTSIIWAFLILELYI